MSDLNKVFSQYVFLFSTVIATLALLVVEINVDHIKYKYIEGVDKPTINFNILDSKLFDSQTYSDLLSDNNDINDTNSSSYNAISDGFSDLLNDSNIDEVIDFSSLSANEGTDVNDTLSSIDVNISQTAEDAVIHTLQKQINTLKAKARIKQLQRQKADIENELKKDHK